MLYAMAVVLGGFAAILAWAWPEARVTFIKIGVGIAGGLWWAARRFPAGKRVHLIGAALSTLAVGLATAIMFPSTQILCDCPPRHVTGPWNCNCPVDHHTHLRIAIAVAGSIGAWLLLVLANRRRTPVQTTSARPENRR